MPAGEGREILFESAVQGGVAKATAIDPTTGVEVSVIGPAHASSRDALKAAAVRKLEYVLRNKRGEV
jgi:hypothetical protein